ncbi:MAG: thioredoxin domain-containing protein [Anaerolineales bacterium]|nr:thioredoxin domain-containing protein [Anaerolineales bacterium]
MLGTEPEIVANQVARGEVQIVFWPVLNHGNPSVYSTLTAECVAQQSTDAFWQIHELLFANQDDLWSADRDYYVNLAVSIGVDQAAFEACYDGPSGLDTVLALDDLRRQRGIFSQPTFDVNGQIFAGRQSYETFDTIFTQLLPTQ